MMKSKLLPRLGFKKTNTTTLSNRIITSYTSNNYEVTISFVSLKDDEDEAERNLYTIDLSKRHQMDTPPKNEASKSKELVEEESFLWTESEFFGLYPNSKTKVINSTIIKEKPNEDGRFILDLDKDDELVVFNDKLFGNYCLIIYGHVHGYVLKKNLKKYSKSAILVLLLGNN